MAVARTGVACMPAAKSTLPVEIASTSSLQPPTSTMLRSTFISLGHVLRHLDEGAAPLVGGLVLDEVGRVAEHGELELSAAPHPLPGGFGMGDARRAKRKRRQKRQRHQFEQQLLHVVAPSVMAGLKEPHCRGMLDHGVAALTNGEPVAE